MTHRTRALPLLASVLLLAAPAAGAQVAPPPPRDARVTRFLPVVELAFVDSWKPSPGLGALYQLSLGRSRTGLDPDGFPVTRGPTVYLHALATAGVFRDADDDWAPRALGQLGVVRRLGGAVTEWGVVAHGISAPWGVGPAGRVELLDNLGLLAGWTVAGDARSRGPFVSVDASLGVLQLLF